VLHQAVRAVLKNPTQIPNLNKKVFWPPKSQDIYGAPYRYVFKKLHVGLHIRLLQIRFLHIRFLHIGLLHIGLLHIRSLHIGLLHIGLLQYRVIVISGFCSRLLGFLSYRVIAYRVIAISGYCHIGFLLKMARVFVYRVIDIGFLTIGLLKSGFDLESCLRCAPRPENCEKLSKKFENRLILAKFGPFWPQFMNLNHVLKQVGRTRAGDLFKF
jgi:hypothetical protein